MPDVYTVYLEEKRSEATVTGSVDEQGYNVFLDDIDGYDDVLSAYATQEIVITMEGPPGPVGGGVASIIATPPLVYDPQTGVLGGLGTAAAHSTADFDPAGAAAQVLAEAEAYVDAAVGDVEQAFTPVVWVQATPVSSVTISHPFTGNPTVVAMGTDGRQIFPGVSYPASGQVQLTTTPAMSYTATLKP